MKPYLVALGLSLVISWILTPAVKKLAFHLGAVDRPNARKVHHRIMPRMGGLAIFIGFMTAALTTLELTTDVIGILLGGAAIAAVGMVDDMIQQGQTRGTDCGGFDSRPFWCPHRVAQ